MPSGFEWKKLIYTSAVGFVRYVTVAVNQTFLNLPLPFLRYCTPINLLLS